MAFRAFSGTVAVMLVVLLSGAVLAATEADEPLPLPVLPSEVTETPGFVGPTDAPPASISSLPSGQPGGKLSPPSQQQIEDARKALDRLRKQGKGTPTAALTEVAGPAADEGGSVTSPISAEAWWTIGAGLLVLLVASETTRLRLKRAKHRKQA